MLWVPYPAESTSIETVHGFTFDTQPDLGKFSPLGIFPPPAPAPVTAAHRDGNHTAVTTTHHQLPPPPSEAPAQRARPIRSRTKPLSPQRRAKALESLTQQPSYHSLPTADREYFHQVVTKLCNAPYLVSPHSLEPNVGSLDGHLLIAPRRSIGPGAAADRESVYAVLVDRPSEGAYVCWICGERRGDRRLDRALDHVRGHFNHRPYHCSEAHFNQQTELTSSSPLPSVW